MRLLATLTAAALLAIPMAAHATPTCTASGAVGCFVETGTIVTYTVPGDGIYDFVAYGAQGGNATAHPGVFTGGLGAEIGGTFTLRAGDILMIGVGATGLNGTLGGGGGGGSFVVLTGGPDDVAATLILLLIASGGGGGSGFNGGNGSATTTASNGSNGLGGTNAGLAGTGGNGAGVATNAGAAGGGAGFLSNGSANSTGGTLGGKSFGNGLAGGTTTNTSGASGGFGGGGGGSNTGGGGGGWNGGGGGFNGGGGGGGGSFFNTTFGTQNLAQTIGGANSGNGLLVITAESSTSAPEPASLALFGVGAAVLGMIRRRRRT